MKLLNSFSLQMLEKFPASIHFKELKALPSEYLESFIGHTDTAAVLGVQMNRENCTLIEGETFIVAQLQGGRLPEGSTTLPEGFDFRFFEGVIS